MLAGRQMSNSCIMPTARHHHIKIESKMSTAARQPSLLGCSDHGCNGRVSIKAAAAQGRLHLSWRTARVKVPGLRMANLSTAGAWQYFQTIELEHGPDHIVVKRDSCKPKALPRRRPSLQSNSICNHTCLHHSIQPCLCLRLHNPKQL